MTEQVFIHQYSQLPEALKQELLAFMDYLVFKHQTNQKMGQPAKKNGKGPSNKVAPKAGFLKGSFVMSPDFDEPLEDFKDYMA